MGSLMHLAVAMKPDISFLNQFNGQHSNVHWSAAKRVLRYLEGTLKIGLIHKPSDAALKGYVDAAWASCLMGKRLRIYVC